MPIIQNVRFCDCVRPSRLHSVINILANFFVLAAPVAMAKAYGKMKSRGLPYKKADYLPDIWKFLQRWRATAPLPPPASYAYLLWRRILWIPLRFHGFPIASLPLRIYAYLLPNAGYFASFYPQKSDPRQSVKREKRVTDWNSSNVVPSLKD